MTQNPRNSAWEESYANERERVIARQGGAQDAERRVQRHKKRSARNPNRTFVSNYSNQFDTEHHEFNAIAPESHKQHYRNSSSSFGERNARASWTSSSNAGFPNSRGNSPSNLRRFIIPIIVLVVLVIAIVLIVRSCSG